MIGMVRVEKHKPKRVFLPNKDIGGSLYGRVVHQWRGRKYVVWVRWTIEQTVDISAQHGLDVEAELMKIVAAEFKAEFYAELGANRHDDLMESFMRLCGETHEQ